MKKNAFTLAEVLITLGVIGVVAAITLPTVIGNYQKKVWVNQLKKSVSTLEQGFKKMLVDEGVDSLKMLEMFDYSGDCPCYFNGADSTERTLYENTLKKYFKIIDFSYNPEDLTYKALDKALGEDYPLDSVILYLNDGSKYAVDFCSAFSDSAGGIHIDVNGDKSPNQLGRDIFLFRLLNSGNLEAPESSCENGWGYGCSRRVIEDGWKINY